MIIGGHFSDATEHDKCFELAGRYGAKCFQTFAAETYSFFPLQYSADHLASFKAKKTAAGLQVAVHGSYIVNIAYDGTERNKFELGIRSIVAQLQNADAMGADFLVMHIGSHKEQGWHRGRENLIRASATILERTVGIKTVLLYENSAGGGTQTGHIPDLYEVLLAINDPRLGLCIDTAHAFADGLMMDDRHVRRQVWETYGNQVRWLHWNNPDPKVNLGSHLDRHSEPWNRAKWPVEVMLQIAEEMKHVPLCMEAGGPGAYDYNFMTLEDEGLL